MNEGIQNLDDFYSYEVFGKAEDAGGQEEKEEGDKEETEIGEGPRSGPSFSRFSHMVYPH